MDFYEGYPRFYEKEDVEVKLEDGTIITAMVYIMTYKILGRIQLNLPSRRYLETVKEDYKTSEIDKTFIEAARAISEKAIKNSPPSFSAAEWVHHFSRYDLHLCGFRVIYVSTKSKEVKEMMFQNNKRFEDRSGKVYEIAGKWCRDIVLSPINVSDADCLICASGELYELIETSHLKYMGGGK